MNDIHTIPLVDVIPFSPSNASNVLVLDSLPTDADFVVTSLVREILQYYQYQQPQQHHQSSSSKSSSKPSSKSSSSHRHPQSHQPQPQPVGRVGGGAVYYISGTPTTPDHISTRLLSTKRGMLLLSNAAAATAATASVAKKKNTTTTTAKNNITTPASSSPDPHHHNNSNKSSSRLLVRCIPSELATMLLASTKNPKAEGEDEKSDDILKEIYRDLKRWIKIQKQHQKASSLSTSTSVAGVGVGAAKAVSWIVLDDLDTISTLVGETSVYCFVGSLLSVVKEHNQHENGDDNIGLIVRCNNDHQQRIYESVRRQNNNGDDDYTMVGDSTGGGGFGSGVGVGVGGGVTSVDNNTSIPIYAGAGGSYHVQAAQISDWTTSTTTTRTTEMSKSIAAASQMVEPSMDTIIDVMTLPSGFSRDAQGRIIISETPYGRGWTKTNSMTTTTTTSTTSSRNNIMSSNSSGGSSSNKGVNASIIVNYQVTDSGPRAIRLRTK